MATISATKEVLWRAQIDEFAQVNIQRVTRIIDDDGEASEKYWRRVITPDDDIQQLATDLNVAPAVATRLGAIINAARYPEAVQRYNDRKAASPEP